MSALRSGLAAGLRHRRLALSLWLSLLVTALLTWPALRRATDFLDDSPFREQLAQGWDSWAMLSWIGTRMEPNEVALALIPAVLLASILLQLALTGGLLRVLVADVNRPVLRRLVAESAALFRPSLWAFSRYLVTLAFWEGILVVAPIAILKKIAGEAAPPHGPLAEVGFWWGVVAGTLVFFAVGVRFDLARIALARGDAPTARGAYRVAKLRLSGSRAQAVGLAVFWIAVGLAVQAAFTHLGIRMNPRSDGATFGLFVFRQLGFVVLAAVRVAYWGSFLAFEERRRPKAFVPLGHPAVMAPLPIHVGGPLHMPAPAPLPEPTPQAAAEPASEPEPPGADTQAPDTDPFPETAPTPGNEPSPAPEAKPESEPDPFPEEKPPS